MSRPFPQHRFLSTLSQPRHVVTYVVACLGLTFALYLGVEWVGAGVAWFGVPLLVVLMMTINFHHYLVDGWIWKMRKPAMQSHLGLTG